MSVSKLRLHLCLVMIVLASACRSQGTAATPGLPSPGSPLSPSVVPAPSLVQTTPLHAEGPPTRIPLPSPTTLFPTTHPAGLFSETTAVGTPEIAPYVTRSRFVQVNLALLIDETGEPRAVHQVTVKLFPDVTYTCLIERVENNAGSYAWVGELEGIENSEFVMVYTAGVFMAHFASPEGVYEVANAGAELYRVTLIDQQKLQDHGE